MVTPDQFLAAVRADADRVKFCPHMDWQSNNCSACRQYRLAWNAASLVEAVEAVLALDTFGTIRAAIAAALEES